jgi:hypothetical protein
MAKKLGIQKGDILADRDRYIAGVPCWVDTSQPDPEAALPFYSGLFGWEFQNVMPEGSGGTYYIARIRGGDLAAVTRIADGSPRLPRGIPLSGSTTPMRRPTSPAKPAATWW